MGRSRNPTHTPHDTPRPALLQGTLGASDDPGIDGAAPAARLRLDEGSWVEVSRGWLRGADTLLDALIPAVPWHQGRRRMYDRVLDEPRLSCSFPRDAAVPHPALATIRAALEQRWTVPMTGVFLNYYRDGDDSVAWHGDRELRHLDDTLVAIITLGAARPFLLRPQGGGPARDLRPGSGDLLMMGGCCQRDWEHAVPKVASAGPRISLSMRWSSACGPATPRASSRYGSRAASSSPAAGNQSRASSRHARARASSMP